MSVKESWEKEQLPIENNHTKRECNVYLIVYTEILIKVNKTKTYSTDFGTIRHIQHKLPSHTHILFRLVKRKHNRYLR